MTFAAVLLLTGCGHNAIQYGDGIGFDVGINPNNYMLSLNLRYGKILSAVVRDNVKLELSGKADANGMTGDPNTAGQVPMAISRSKSAVRSTVQLSIW